MLDYQVQTAFIFQFTNYIEWTGSDQASGNANFSICVIGQSPIVQELEALAKEKKVKDKKMVLYEAPNGEQLKKCKMVVMAEANEGQLREVAKTVKGTGALIISNTEGFASKGSMINFILEGGRVRFEINRSAIEGQKFQIGSQLLKIAKLVE